MNRKLSITKHLPAALAVAAVALALVHAAPARAELVPVYSFRVAGGVSAGEDVTPGVDVDLGGVFFQGRTSGSAYGFGGWGLILAPELGYLYSQETHAFDITCGVGFGHAMFGVMYRPRLMIGGGDHGVGAGMRNAVALTFLRDIINIESGYEFIGDERGVSHGFIAHAGINFGSIYQWARERPAQVGAAAPMRF